MKLSSLLKHLVVAILFVTGLAFVQADWQAPIGAPPNSNVEGALNTGSTAQTKTGILGVSDIITRTGGIVGTTGLNATQYTAAVTGLAAANPFTRLYVGGRVAATDFCTLSPGGLTTSNCLSRKSGITFIDPVLIRNAGSPVGYTTVDALGIIPLGATAVILQAQAGMSGPDNGTVAAEIYIREEPGAPSYVLLRGAASGAEDGTAFSGQGFFPVTPLETFQYSITGPGFDWGASIQIIGYVM